MLSASFAFAQSSAALKKKKEELQREINLLQKNANKAANNKKLTLSQINALNAKISLMQDKITVINSEIKNLDNQIHENTNTVQNLTGQLGQLKTQYAAMIRFAQRNKSSYDRMMFVFASRDFNQAYKRIKYLQQIGQYRKKQADYIQGKEKDLRYKIVILDKSLKEKSSLMQEQESEKDELGKNKEVQSKVLDKFSKQESQYKQDIAERKKKQIKLDGQIRDAIARDIALAKKKAEQEERAAIAAAAARARARANALRIAAAKATAARAAAIRANAVAKAGKTVPVPPAPPAEEAPEPVAVIKEKSASAYLTSTPESAKLSDAFERNRGSIPWPVASGSITERFGKHMQGQASYTNDGINIETAEGASVRAVFNGRVSIVHNQYGKYFILIKHGEYYTVYSNLKSVNVSGGDNVTTKQVIGTVASSEGRPELQFQIRRGINPQNPEAWISK